MKILFYSHSSTLYGAPASLINLISGLIKINPKINVHVILPSNGGLENKLKVENISYSVIPHYKWTYNYEIFNRKLKTNKTLAYLWLYKNMIQRYFQNLFQFRRHQKFVAGYKPDIIYVNSSMAPMGCKLALNRNIPLVWHHRETINDPITGFYLDNNYSFKKYFRDADLHLYPSAFLKKSYEIFKNTGKQSIVFNGVSYDGGLSNKPYNKKNSIKFGMVGRVNSQKGQAEVISVFHELQKLNGIKAHELHLFGGGEEMYINELKNICNNNIIFRGFKDQNTIYHDLDFVIVNARNESFGRVVAEANSYGIPVIALNSGALNEIVFDGLNGYTYNSNKELYNAIKRILLADSNLINYATLSKSSRKCFENYFSVEAYSQSIFRELLLLIK